MTRHLLSQRGRHRLRTRVLVGLHAFGYWLWCITDDLLPDDAERRA